MNRRRVLIGLCAIGAAPSLARGQQRAKLHRVGVLLGQSETDPYAYSRYEVFKESLAALGWSDGRNITLHTRWSGGDVNRASALAKELVALKPDVIVCTTTHITASLQRETRTIPIVFMAVSDPVGSGFVKTLSQPGGNITGFVDLEPTLIEKSVELLKEIAPRVSRVAVLFNPDTAPYAEAYLRPLKTAGPKLGVTTSASPIRRESEIEKAISSIARERHSGFVVMPDSFMGIHRKPTIALAARYKLPATYFAGPWVLDGGLSSYGVDVVDLRRRAPAYVDRILRGAKVAELPVQSPVKFEIFLNLKTAQALGLSVPQAVLLRADKVIE